MPPRRSLPLRGTRIALIVGVIFGLAIGGSGLISPGLHTYCAVGSKVATVSLATPLAVTNSPYMGASSLNLSGYGPQYTFYSGTLAETSDPWAPVPGVQYASFENGSEPWGLYMTVNWTVYSVQNVTGISVSGPCTQSYIAEADLIPPANPHNPPRVFQLSLPIITTDLGEPTSIPGTESVQFFNGLDTQLWNLTAQSGVATYFPYAGGLSDCLAPPHSWTIYPSGTLRVPIAVPFTVQGRAMESGGFLTWSGLNGDPAVAYTMPNLNGSWTFTSVGAPFPQTPALQAPVPAGLYSFSYEPCPS